MSKKIIFITGVTSGVGRETARRFIKEGWKVIGTGRRQSRLDELAAELGGDFLPLCFDVAKRDVRGGNVRQPSRRVQGHRRAR